MGAQATSPDHYPPAAKPLNFLYASVSLHNNVFLLMYQCIMSHNFPLHMAVVILPLLDWLPGDRGMSPLWGRIVSTRRMGGAPMIGLGGAHWIASSVKDRASLLGGSAHGLVEPRKLSEQCHALQAWLVLGCLRACCIYSTLPWRTPSGHQ